MTRNALGLLLACLAATSISASIDAPVDIPERGKGADRVVVATVLTVAPAVERNAFGDQVIVSHTQLLVEETVKGDGPQLVALDVEGGTVGNLTMRVSDMELVGSGDRAVFFLRKHPSGRFVPHLRGLGILKLDRENRVLRSSLTLRDIKNLVQLGHR
jgi:hypothetical protein